MRVEDFIDLLFQRGSELVAFRGRIEAHGSMMGKITRRDARVGSERVVRLGNMFGLSVAEIVTAYQDGLQRPRLDCSRVSKDDGLESSKEVDIN
jgi:hypothetical protein